MTSVVPIRPKKLNRRYRGQVYTLTYEVESKKWKWDVAYTQTTHCDGIADTMNKAQKAAEKHIDRLAKAGGG